MEFKAIVTPVYSSFHGGIQGMATPVLQTFVKCVQKMEETIYLFLPGLRIRIKLILIRTRPQDFANSDPDPT